MAKTVGFSRNLKLQWLNKTVELVFGGLTEQDIKQQLNEYLSFEIESITNARKTREILMHIWVYSDRRTNKIRASALKLIKQYPEHALVVHWCMMLAVYPVFADMCKLIGKLSQFSDEITTAQLKQRLFDEWGERSTLLHSVDKLVATLKAMDVLESEKPGKYRVKKHKASNAKLAMFMVYAVMLADGGSYYDFDELEASDYLFPFEYQIDREVLLDDNSFALNSFGGKPSVSLSE